jgi:hypothetical protein
VLGDFPPRDPETPPSGGENKDRDGVGDTRASFPCANVRSGVGQGGKRVRRRSRRALVGRARIRWLPVGRLRIRGPRREAPSGAAGVQSESPEGWTAVRGVSSRMRVIASVDVTAAIFPCGPRSDRIRERHSEIPAISTTPMGLGLAVCARRPRPEAARGEAARMRRPWPARSQTSPRKWAPARQSNESGGLSGEARSRRAAR